MPQDKSPKPPDGESAIAELLASSKTIAVVGLSSKPFRPSFGVSQYLQSAGYRIIPVNPNESLILGEKCYARLKTSPKRSTSLTFSAVLSWSRQSPTRRFASAPAPSGCKKASRTNLLPPGLAVPDSLSSWTSASPKNSTSSTPNIPPRKYPTHFQKRPSIALVRNFKKCTIPRDSLSLRSSDC